MTTILGIFVAILAIAVIYWLGRMSGMKNATELLSFKREIVRDYLHNNQLRDRSAPIKIEIGARVVFEGSWEDLIEYALILDRIAADLRLAADVEQRLTPK